MRRRWDTTILVVAVASAALTLALATGGAVLVDTGRVTWLMLALPAILALGCAAGMTSPWLALAILMASVASERVNVPLLVSGSVNVRLDELVDPAVALGVVVRHAGLGRLSTALKRIPGLLPLGLFLVENAVSTLLYDYDRAHGFSLLVQLVMGLACYVAIALITSELREAGAIAVPLLSLGAIEAAIGLVALLLSMVLAEPDLFGVSFNYSSGQVEPYGTMYEPNFFGHLTASIALLAIALLLERGARGTTSRARAGHLIAALLCFGGMSASLTRAAWLGFAAGLIMLVLLARERSRPYGPAGHHTEPLASRSVGALRRLGSLIGLVSLTAVVIGGVLLLSGGASSVLASRLGSILDVQTGSGYGRAQLFQLAIAEWQRSPLLGLGNGSFHTYLPGQPLDQKPWLDALAVAILHDSGVVGLALFAWFMLAVFRALLRVTRTTPTGTLHGVAAGLVGALICLLVAAQATTSFYLMLFWVLLGAAGAVPVLAAGIEQPAAPAATPVEALAPVPAPAALARR